VEVVMVNTQLFILQKQNNIDNITVRIQNLGNK